MPCALSKENVNKKIFFFLSLHDSTNGRTKNFSSSTLFTHFFPVPFSSQLTRNCVVDFSSHINERINTNEKKKMIEKIFHNFSLLFSHIIVKISFNFFFILKRHFFPTNSHEFYSWQMNLCSVKLMLDIDFFRVNKILNCTRKTAPIFMPIAVVELKKDEKMKKKIDEKLWDENAHTACERVIISARSFSIRRRENFHLHLRLVFGAVLFSCESISHLVFI